MSRIPGVGIGPNIVLGPRFVATQSVQLRDRSRAPIGIQALGDTTSRGRPTHIFIGMVIGTVAGAGVGYALGTLSCAGKDAPSEGPPCSVGTELTTVLGAFIGLVAGGIIGAHHDQRAPDSWKPRLSVGMIPHGMRRMMVGVSAH